MKKFLLSFFVTMAATFTLMAQEKLSSPSLNFLQSYESNEPAQRARLKARYAIQEEQNDSWISAYLHLSDENDSTGLDENGVKVNAQYGTILSVQIPVEKLRIVSELPSVKYIEVGQRVRPLMSRVRTEEFCNIDNVHQGTNLDQAYTGKDVVVGIIDCGFQYNHINFCDANGETRIKRVWEQSISGTNPSGYYYGSEYKTPEKIANLTDDFYSGEAHATHVAGIAAGSYSGLDYKGGAPDADLVFVSFNAYDSSSSNTSISDAIKYIYDYADSVGKPCVINMSLGSHTGPHDGTSTFDRICDQLQGKGKLLVGSAGNERNYNIHVSKVFNFANKDNLKALLSFGSTPAASAKEAVVDIWGDTDKPISARVFLYNKTTNTEVSSSSFYSTEQTQSYTLTNLSGTYGNIYISTTTDPFNNKGNVNINIDNIIYTSDSDYAIGIEVESPTTSTVHAWVDDYNYLACFAQTSLDGFVSGNDNSTVGEIGGTGKRIISVGAYTSCNNLKHKYSSNYNYSTETVNDLTSFSSLGPTADKRIKPDITAPGSKVVSSFKASASSSSRTTYYQLVTDVATQNSTKYYFGSMEGTSMASPVVTGILATWLQAFPQLTPEQVRDVLKETATTDTYTGDIGGTGNNQWGYGKINAYDGVVYCLNLAASIDKVTAESARPLLYPNPATDHCYIVFPNNDNQVKLSIVAPNGAVVYTQTHDSVQVGEQLQLDLQGITSGLYLVQIVGEHAQHTLKLMKQ